MPILKNCSLATARRGGYHSALSKTFHDEGVSCNVVVIWPSHFMNWKQFRALRSTVWFFCDAFFFACSGIDIIETGWDLSIEKLMWIISLIIFVALIMSRQGIWAELRCGTIPS
jgi:hypothetical protein